MDHSRQEYQCRLLMPLLCIQQSTPMPHCLLRLCLRHSEIQSTPALCTSALARFANSDAKTAADVACLPACCPTGAISVRREPCFISGVAVSLGPHSDASTAAEAAGNGFPVVQATQITWCHQVGGVFFKASMSSCPYVVLLEPVYGAHYITAEVDGGGTGCPATCHGTNLKLLCRDPNGTPKRWILRWFCSRSTGAA